MRMKDRIRLRNHVALAAHPRKLGEAPELALARAEMARDAVVHDIATRIEADPHAKSRFIAAQERRQRKGQRLEEERARREG